MDMGKYYLALGRFIVLYADVEGHLFMTLRHTAGIEIPTAQALFSGTRVGVAISFIRRLFESKNAVIPDRLNEALKHLNSITTARDHLLHYGVTESENGLRSINELKAHSERTLAVMNVSPELLDDMTADLGTIVYVLAVHMASKDFAHEFTDPNYPKAQTMLAASLAPWRYTPAAPSK